jgi:hypothetical protein
MFSISTFAFNLILLYTLTGCMERDKNVTTIFEILIALLLEIYTQAGMLCCDVGQNLPTNLREVFTFMTHRVILEVLGFQDWNCIGRNS